MWIPESAFSKLWIARDNGKKMNANDVVDVLNELHTENQELKKALCERNVAEQLRREYDEFWNEKIKNRV